MGFDCKYVLKSFGGKLAGAAVCDRYRNAEDMIRQIGENSYKNDMETVVTSCIPLIVRLRCSFRHPLMAEAMLDIYEGSLLYVLNTFTGQQYTVKSREESRSCGHVRTLTFTAVHPPFEPVSRLNCSR